MSSSRRSTSFSTGHLPEKPKMPTSTSNRTAKVEARGSVTHANLQDHELSLRSISLSADTRGRDDHPWHGDGMSVASSSRPLLGCYEPSLSSSSVIYPVSHSRSVFTKSTVGYENPVRVLVKEKKSDVGGLSEHDKSVALAYARRVSIKIPTGLTVSSTPYFAETSRPTSPSLRSFQLPAKPSSQSHKHHPPPSASTRSDNHKTSLPLPLPLPPSPLPRHSPPTILSPKPQPPLRPPKIGGYSKNDQLESVEESWGPRPAHNKTWGLFQPQEEVRSRNTSPFVERVADGSQVGVGVMGEMRGRKEGVGVKEDEGGWGESGGLGVGVGDHVGLGDYSREVGEQKVERRREREETDLEIARYEAWERARAGMQLDHNRSTRSETINNDKSPRAPSITPSNHRRRHSQQLQQQEELSPNDLNDENSVITELTYRNSVPSGHLTASIRSRRYQAEEGEGEEDEEEDEDEFDCQSLWSVARMKEVMEIMRAERSRGDLLVDEKCAE